MNKIRLIICILLLNTAFQLNAQIDSANSVLTGTIRNAKDKKLPGVTVAIYNKTSQEIFRGKTNSDGEYSIDAPKGKYRLTASMEGFTQYEKDEVILNESKVVYTDITLTEKLYSTDEIEVLGQKQQQNDLRTSWFNVSPANIKVLPGGLEDVMRSLKSLPGVTAPNDFTSQLIVRGSGPDQNLIIMDEVEIFNPYRLYGLVSMFNPETLSDINLITGGFPAKYGDRLSAVLDVTNKEGVTDRKLSVITNINIANTNIVLQGKNPLKIPGSWLVSTRRTYYDLILGPFARSAKLITDDSSFPSFEDVQFKLAFGPFKKSKFIINGIFSKDGVDIIPGSERSNPDSVNVNDVTNNNVLAVGWHYNPNPGFISKTTFSWYRNSGDNQFDGDIIDPLIDKENLTPEQRDSLRLIGALLGFDFKSTYAFRKLSLGNRSVLLSGSNKYEFGGGVDIIRNDLTYSLNLDPAFKAFLNSLPNARPFLQDFTINGKDNYRASSYGLARFEVGKQFFWQPSLRLDYYSLLSKVYVSPRFNVGYAFDPLTTLRSSVGVYYQSPGYEKLVDNQTFYDLASPQVTDLKAERSLHFVLGVDRWLNSSWLLKLEAYYKRFDNLIVSQRLTAYRYKYSLLDPNNHDPIYMKNPSNWVRSADRQPIDSVTSIPVNAGTGNSYGIEISLERKYTGPTTRLYGWINYSLSKATRERYGVESVFRFDQTHNINVVLNYRVNNWFEVGARWNYASNFPFTEPLGITPRVVSDTLVVNPLTNQVIFNLDYGDDNNRFASRRPAYHRLDIRLSANTRFWNAEWSFYLDVINVYNRKNVLTYNYTIGSDLSVKQKVVGMFPILPTLGVNARF
ncbi:MAG: TonB-dependent receptor [Ignavibacteria bacterium]